MSEDAAPRKRAASSRRSVPVAVAAVVSEPVVPAVEYVAGRRMLFNGVTYEQGDPVPGAEKAFRLETLIANRYLKKV